MSALLHCQLQSSTTSYMDCSHGLKCKISPETSQNVPYRISYFDTRLQTKHEVVLGCSLQRRQGNMSAGWGCHVYSLLSRQQLQDE